MNTRTKVAVLGLALLTGSAIAQAVDPFPAHADTSTYLDTLGRNGIPASANATATQLGWQVCTDVDLNGTQGITNEAAMGHAVGMSAHDISTIIVAALTQLCPDNAPVLDSFLAQSKSVQGV